MICYIDGHTKLDRSSLYFRRHASRQNNNRKTGVTREKLFVDADNEIQ
jgi:hypothetical protein